MIFNVTEVQVYKMANPINFEIAFRTINTAFKQPGNWSLSNFTLKNALRTLAKVSVIRKLISVSDNEKLFDNFFFVNLALALFDNFFL